MDKIFGGLIVALLAFLGFIGLVVGLSILFAYPTMWLINYLFSAAFLGLIFGGKLTLWKALWFNFFVGFVLKSSYSSSKE